MASLVNKEVAAAAAPAPAAPDPAAPVMNPVDPAPAGKQAQENDRFTPSPDGIPEGLPEKFLKDGKPDYSALITSYTELEKWKGGKTDELKSEWEKERLAARPESIDGYTIPDIDIINKEEMAADPLFQWWKKESFDKGFSQEQFEAGIKQYVEANAPQPIDYEAEVKKLGDNGNARVKVVANWMEKFKENPSYYAKLDEIAGTAEGIELLEVMMTNNGVPLADPSIPSVPTITLADLKTMQADPRYYDSTRRDPAFVQKVDEGFEKLYAKK